MIAGLEEITGGDLYIDGEFANELEPKDRDTAMVFQSYALYPHMTVYDNMAFGLQMRHVPKDEIEERVKKAAEILQITEYLDRKPNAKVFLMDEPLSNLDAKLRVQMRSEIVKLHNELGATTIYVTHDQIEAMTMASRIVVMNKGYIQQIGAPKVIYNHPANTFVATFIGSPAMNIIEGTYHKDHIDLGGITSFKLDKDMIKAHDEFYNAEIKKAEGAKQAAILEAEGIAEAKIKVANAEAEAVKILAAGVGDKANPASYQVSLKYIEAMTTMTEGKDNKIIYMPYEASNVLGAVAAIKDLTGGAPQK